MTRLNEHLRRTFFAGIFAAIPIAVTAIIIWYVESRTDDIVTPLLRGHRIPFLGVAVAIALIYLAGLLVTSLIGQYILGTLDRLLLRMPGFRDIYRIWKQIALTPAGTLGVYAQVVMIHDETGSMRLLGFCSGQPIPGDDNTMCVFVPNYPNAVTGRLYFVPVSLCIPLALSVDEAFKVIISGGNYLPEHIGLALKAPHVNAGLPNTGLRPPTPSPHSPPASFSDTRSPVASLPDQTPNT